MTPQLIATILMRDRQSPNSMLKKRIQKSMAIIDLNKHLGRSYMAE
jgi:hypothetical protein